MVNKRIYYADILRISAVFTVIFLHVATYRMYGIPVATYEWHVFNVYNSMSRWCVPVFFMLSGMFLLDPNKQVRTVDIYSKQILRILCALVFWGMAYNYIPFAIDYLIQKEPKDLHALAVFPRQILFGPPWYHLWFLYSIIGLYMITPLLRIFIRNAEKKDLEYILILFVIFGNAIPLANTFLGRIDKTYVINMAIPELSGYAGYFIAGYYFSKYDMRRIWRNALHILAASSLVLTILASALLSEANGITETCLYDFLLPNTLFPAFSIFVFFKQKFTEKKKNDKSTFLVSCFSECSFGIYLVHDFFNSFFSALEISTLAFNPIFSVPLISITIFCLSLMTVILIKRLPFISTYII